MFKQEKGEIWVGLHGVGFAMHAEQKPEERPDGSVSFIRIVDYKGTKRKERVDTRKEHLIYLSETIEAD